MLRSRSGLRLSFGLTLTLTLRVDPGPDPNPNSNPRATLRRRKNGIMFTHTQAMTIKAPKACVLSILKFEPLYTSPWWPTTPNAWTMLLSLAKMAGAMRPHVPL